MTKAILYYLSTILLVPLAKVNLFYITIINNKIIINYFVHIIEKEMRQHKKITYHQNQFLSSSLTCL